MLNSLYKKIKGEIPTFSGRKITLILVLAFSFSLKTNAQFVTIADTAFVNYLQAHYPACMVGNQMDTTCAGITGAITVNVANDSIGDLTGIQYFDNLDTLICNNNFLGHLPPLPNSLLALNCSFNYLEDMPSLPSNLSYLDCSNNWIYCFSPLPSSITSIYFSNNYFTCLPNHIPAMGTDTLVYPVCIFNDQNNPYSCPTSVMLGGVVIPDSGFVAWLQFNVQGSMNGNRLDTNCAQVTNTPWLNISSFTPIYDVFGVQFFDSLQSLTCWGGTITSLPPQLPAGLTYLDCWMQPITSLPSLPSGLLYLNVSETNVTNLPPLPATLLELEIGETPIASFPILPSGLTRLGCYNDNFTNLPPLPPNLTSLDCRGNPLHSLPALPTSLEILDCSSDSLASLPLLPVGLKNLFCAWNELTTLPTLPPGLIYLHAGFNNITCFPPFPDSLTDPDKFYIDYNPFTCLPNYTPAMYQYDLSFPLCYTGDTINNPFGCTSAEGIVGKVYKDANSNCVFDSGDNVKGGIKMKAYNNSGNLIQQIYSFANGNYNFHDTSGTYTIEMDTVGMPYQAQCIYPGYDSIVTLSSTNPLAENVNFAIECKPGFDLGVQSIVRQGRAFPGIQHRMLINSGDMSQWYNLNCGAGVSGTVQVTITGPVTYLSPYLSALTPVVSGNTLTYSIADFGLINNATAFNSIFTTDTTAILGDQICVTVVITPTTGIDNNPINNTMTYCYNVVNSFDPNIKETYPSLVAPGFDDYFYYTIHFQNTGTAAAQNIRITDSLSALLDVSTFQEINYSHTNIVTLDGHYLTVRFPQINLTDSTSNETASHGFIQYRIKPLAGLPDGTHIYNTANIYFDYNAPITTNTSENIYDVTTGIKPEIALNNVVVYPNPATNQLQVQSLKFKVESIHIYNLLGECVYQSEIKQLNNVTIDISNLTKGVYFIKVTDENSNSINKKIIIQ